MPIYEYACQDCGTKFEKLMKSTTQADGVACPSCGKDHVAMQLSTFAAHSHARAGAAPMPSCPGGMCRTPDLCGRN